MLNKKDILDFQKWGNETVFKAGKILLRHKNNFNILKRKTDFNDIATDADQEVEDFLIEKIKNKYCNHSIYAEETGKNITSSNFLWTIDPLDGTKEFIRRIPYYGINLALEYKNKLIYGIFYQPEINRYFYAGKGLGAFCKNEKIFVSKKQDLKKSFVYLGIPCFLFSDTELDRYFTVIKKLIKKTYRVRNSTWDIEALCNIAFGAGDGYLLVTNKKYGPKWYDIAPGVLIVEEAGGKITDIYGNLLNKNNLSNGVLASNKLLHQTLLNIVK